MNRIILEHGRTEQGRNIKNTTMEHGEQNILKSWRTEQIRNMENRNSRNMSNKSWNMELKDWVIVLKVRCLFVWIVGWHPLPY
jgi:hypothetical protein